MGDFALFYRATSASGGAATDLTPGERIGYLRPSRYADVDRLEATARALFADVKGGEADGVAGLEADVAVEEDVAVLRAATNYVADHTAYIIGSSRVTDGASDTYLARAGSAVTLHT